MNALEIFQSSSNSVMMMIDDLGFEKGSHSEIIKQNINVSVECTYYIFFHSNKPWRNADLLEF